MKSHENAVRESYTNYYRITEGANAMAGLKVMKNCEILSEVLIIFTCLFGFISLTFCYEPGMLSLLRIQKCPR